MRPRAWQASSNFLGHTVTLTLAQYVAAASAVLTEAGVPSPAADARALAAHVLGLERFPVLPPEALPADFEARFAALVERRRCREPLQHLVGWAPFRHLSLEVRRGVFVPRPETEMVAQVAIDEAAAVRRQRRDPVVVELCCGAGGMALAVASEVRGARVYAMDASAEATELTRANAAAFGIVLAQVLTGDVRDATVFAELDGTVDVVVANPPYIPPDQVPIDPEVRDHDPELALYGGGIDGLEIPRAVLAAAARLLRPGGLLVMEHADSQGRAARDEAHARGGWEQVRTAPDLTGRDRMLVARRAL